MTNEIDRDVLVQHLYDLQALELLRKKLGEDIKKNSEKIEKLGIYRYIAKQPVGSYFLAVLITPIAILMIAFVIFNSNTDRKLVGTDTNIVGYRKETFWINGWSISFEEFWILVAAIALVATVIVLICALSRCAKGRANYKRELNADEERVKKELCEKDKLIVENAGLTNQLKEVNTLLPQTYAINIIPQQFRNLSGVSYLYDYMSTSQATLESAFLNYNMNQIGAQVQRIAEQQYEMILQQYVTNAKLESVEGQNRKMLDQLSNIENNTALSGKYSAITAANTSAMSFVEGYYFFKNG